ncbi:MAG: rRNA maturation RNase YbeY [Clostridia bacterium]|nr:rRNA maturation RNase YbeY [Clostridia bacterium]
MTINILGFALPVYKKTAKRTAEQTLEFLGMKDVELSIKFVSKKEIQRLNKEFRNIDRVTDVLSFPATNCKVGEKLSSGEYAGDMALCLAKAKQQGREYKNGTKAELSKLVTHSILHLVGYDHIKDEDYVVMKDQEDKIEKYIKEQR